MSTPLTDNINALTTYINETTGASDTTLSDAVETLVAGYGESGSSSTWIKITEKSYTIENFTDTAPQIVEIWKTGRSEIWTSNKIVYVRIRDTVGKRAGYFYGTDTFFINPLIKNGSSLTGTQSLINAVWSVDSTSLYNFRYGYSTSYGVYPDYFFNNGNIRISRRYHRSYSGTIDGTYKVEVYLLDPAGGVPIFE